MQRLVLLWLAALLFFPTSSSAQAPSSRHKPGPVFLRGVVVRLERAGFLMSTRTHGSFDVQVSPNTSVSEKGVRGAVRLQVGDHVGVRGFVQGNAIRAIYVHIYPSRAKPKPYSLRGTVSSLQGSTLIVSASGARTAIQLTSKTEVRLGAQLSSTSALRVGQDVLVRIQPVGGKLVAIRVHIYHSKSTAPHVEIKGVVVAVSSRSVTVPSGTQNVVVATTSSTRLYLGNQRSTSAELRPGRTVRVYACCEGQPMVATSIHIRKSTATRVPTSLLRGWVTAVSNDSIRITTVSGSVVIDVNGNTRYAIGVMPARSGSIEVGDEVSVRVARAGSSWSAVSVHVYVSSRRSRTLIGVVVSVSRSGLQMLYRGRRYAVQGASHVRVTRDGQPSSLAAIHPGDHVHVTGRLVGPSTLSATSVVARTTPPKLHTVRGTVVSVANGTLIIADDTGMRTRVQLTPGTALLLHRQPAPRSALFPGVRAAARGVMKGGTLVAVKVTLTVHMRTVLGRVTRNSGSSLVVTRGTTETVKVTLPPGVKVMDGRHPVTVGVGAYVRVTGYEVVAGEVRAETVQVEHPPVSISGLAVSGPTGLVLETSRGDQYRLRFTSKTQLSTGREAVDLTPDTIPPGAHIAVQGKIGTDGSVTVLSITVRLKSATVKGTISAISADSLSIAALPSSVDVRIDPNTTFAQGSHVLTLADLVVGDAVTVYGYDGGGGVILARKVLIHRHLVGMDGTVASVTATGFVLQASDGTHSVILSTTTIYTDLTAGSIVTGMAIHVTGYLRGDGSILATRVRAGKHKKGTVEVTRRVELQES